MKRRAFILLFFYLVALPLVYGVDSLEQCEEIENLYHRSNCYVSEALNILNWDYCSLATYSGFRETECYAEVAFRQGNSELCAEINSSPGRGLCYERFAIQENVTELCRLAESYQGHCYYSLAAKLEDVNLCEQAVAHRPACLYEAAIRLKDPQYCEESENPEECYYILAQEIKSPTLCSETGQQEEECLCEEDEYLVDHSCVKLECREDQAIRNHKCIDLECENHFTAKNHICTPDFLCEDYDGENYEKRSICRSPEGGGWDGCAPRETVLWEMYCRSPTRCDEKNIVCPDYCQESLGVSGTCSHGKCVCFQDPADACDFASNLGEKYGCYNALGIGVGGALLRQGAIQVLLAFIILALGIWCYKSYKRKAQIIKLWKERFETIKGLGSKTRELKWARELNWRLILATSVLAPSIVFWMSLDQYEFTHSLCHIQAFSHLGSVLLFLLLVWKPLLILLPLSFIVSFVLSKKHSRRHGFLSVFCSLIMLGLLLSLPYVLIPFHKLSEQRHIRKMEELKLEAIESRNAELCQETGHLTESCLFAVAVAAGNASLCTPGMPYTANCILQVAVATGDASLCENNPTIQNDCYFLLANKTRDTGLCFRLDDSNPMSDFGFEVPPNSPNLQVPKEEYELRRRTREYGVIIAEAWEPPPDRRGDDNFSMPTIRVDETEPQYKLDCRLAPEWPRFYDDNLFGDIPESVETTRKEETTVEESTPPDTFDLTVRCMEESYCKDSGLTDTQCSEFVAGEFKSSFKAAIDSLDASLCELAGTRRGECYNQLARLTKNGTLCGLARSFSLGCYWNLSRELSDPSLCAWSYSSCLIELAMENEAVEYCDALPSQRTACRKEYAFLTGDSNNCRALTGGEKVRCFCETEFNKTLTDLDCGKYLYIKDSEIIEEAVSKNSLLTCSQTFLDNESCYAMLAVHNGKSSICPLAGSLKEDCYYAVALRTGDYELCEKLSNSNKKKRCATDTYLNATLAMEWTNESSISIRGGAAPNYGGSSREGTMLYENTGKTYLISPLFKMYCDGELHEGHGCHQVSFLLEPEEICVLQFYPPCNNDRTEWGYPGRPNVG